MHNWFEVEHKVLSSHQLAVPLIDLALKRGIDQNKLLSGTGLFLPDLQQSGLAISSKQLFSLITNIEKLSNSRDIAFLMGRRLLTCYPSSIHQLLLQAKHPAHMLKLAACFQQQIFPFLQIQHKYFEHKHYFLLSPALCENQPQQFLLEIMLTAIVSSIKSCMGYQIPIEFSFNFSRPRNIYQYEENLGHRLKFGQHLMMFSLEHQYLTQTFAENQQLMRHILLKQSRLIPQAPVPLLTYINQLQQQQPLSLEQTSEKLGCSAATLKRKLKQHGCNFQQLLDNPKKQQAIFELQIKRQGNEEVARGLNFSDLTNFRRSFKRWTGLTPSEVK